MSKPFFNKESLSYYREEKENHITIVSKKHPETNELVINPTARSILELCNGERELADITGLMAEMYDAPIDVLNKDVCVTLSNLSKLGIIDWKEGEDPFMIRNEKKLSDGYEAVIAVEADIV